ncbi:hypothetical protein P3H15_32485 [Rhodococcus sp. T2V]|uniref:hypothetical protein n=1 Tax=Rhodococcus sp. T2V TaxID=3034164 RepID=UPI0023E277B3|nr:hypothetical protein [Rhodococcus sp. T2V]MDF3309737.1 hypothetical protein [Rhodococcus sp. T2V]
MSRFNLLPLLRGQLKGLTLAARAGTPADIAARAILYGIPTLLTLLALLLDWKLASPVPILTAVSLLAGGTLSAFSSISTLRLKLTDWSEEGDGREVDRESLDESVAHLFMIALACAFDAAILVVGLNFALGDKGTPDEGALTGITAGLAMGVTAYIFLTFVMVLPRLYWAYTKMNRVSRKMSGFDAT